MSACVLGILRWWGREEVCGGVGCLRARGPHALLRLRVQDEPAGKSRGARQPGRQSGPEGGGSGQGLLAVCLPAGLTADLTASMPDPSMYTLLAAYLTPFVRTATCVSGLRTLLILPSPLPLQISLSVALFVPLPLPPADLTAFPPLHRTDGWRGHGRRCGRLGARPVQGRNREVRFDQQRCVITPHHSGLAIDFLATTLPPCSHCRRVRCT